MVDQCWDPNDEWLNVYDAIIQLTPYCRISSARSVPCRLCNIESVALYLRCRIFALRGHSHPICIFRIFFRYWPMRAAGRAWFSYPDSLCLFVWTWQWTIRFIPVALCLLTYVLTSTRLFSLSCPQKLPLYLFPSPFFLDIILLLFARCEESFLWIQNRIASL